MLDNAEREYYGSSLSGHKFDLKQVFNICNGLLGQDKDLPLPPCHSSQVLADQFNTFFTTKIEKIRNHHIDKNCDVINHGITKPTELCMANSNIAISNFKGVEE